MSLSPTNDASGHLITTTKDALPGNFTPWARDAGTLAADHDANWVANLYLVPVPGSDALMSGARVIAAVRGSGKSALLRRHAARLLTRQPDKSVLLRVMPPYVNELKSKEIEIQDSESRQLTSAARWQAIWQCTINSYLAVLAMQSLNSLSDFRLRQSAQVKDLTEEPLIERLIEEEVAKAKRYQDVEDNGSARWTATRVITTCWHNLNDKNSEPIGKLLATLIRGGLQGDAAQLDAISRIASNIFSRIANPDARYYVIIDAVDEAFCGLDEFGDKVALGSLPFDDSVSVWIAAQKGLLFAANQVAESLLNASVITSIRGEVIHQLSTKDIERLTGSTTKSTQVAFTELSYTPSHLKEVFDANVKKTHSENLADASEKDSVKRLFGFVDVWHTSVVFEHERVLDLILRHTFGSPRDLVHLVKQAIDVVPPSKRRSDGSAAMLEALDSAAALLCLDRLSNLVPQIPLVFRSVLPKLSTNIYTNIEVKQFEAREHCDGLFSQLLSAGLVGVPVPKGDSYRLKFLEPRIGNDPFREYEHAFYALHPALSAMLVSMRRIECDGRILEALTCNPSTIPNFSYSRRFIVGQDKTCPDSLDTILLVFDFLNWKITSLDQNRTPHSADLSGEINHPAPRTRKTTEITRMTIAAIVLTAKKMGLKYCRVSVSDVKKYSSDLYRIGFDLQIRNRTIQSSNNSQAPESSNNKELEFGLIGYWISKGLAENSSLRQCMDAYLSPLGLKFRVTESFEYLSLEWGGTSMNPRDWTDVKLSACDVAIPNQRDDLFGGPIYE